VLDHRVESLHDGHVIALNTPTLAVFSNDQ